MFKNKAIESLAPQGVDLIKLIEMQANQQTGTVPQDKSGQFSGENNAKGRPYQKSRPYYNNSVKRHK